MAELVNGDGTIPQATGGWAQKLISSSTNTSPITVTFCSAHCSNEGDTWGIEGHTVNTNANGNWRVHVTGTQTLQLVGSTGNGVGGATGYGIDYSVNPLIQVGDDGDAASASNNNTPIEALANVVPYLYKRAGKYSLYDRRVIASAGGTLTNPGNWSLWGPIADSTWSTIVATETTYPNVVNVGDYLVIEITAVDRTAGAYDVGYAVTLSYNGGAYALGGSFDGNGTPAWMTAASSLRIPFTARYEGLATVKTANANGLSIALAAIQKSGGSASGVLSGPYQIVVTHYRSNA